MLSPGGLAENQDVPAAALDLASAGLNEGQATSSTAKEENGRTQDAVEVEPGVPHATETAVKEIAVAEPASATVNPLEVALGLSAPSEEAPVSVEDALQQIGMTPALQDEPAGSFAEVSSPLSEVGDDAYSSADESIEAYMNRLLDRVRGGGDRGPDLLARDEVLSCDEEGVSQTPKLAAAKPVPLFEDFRPRKTAPELTSDMLAMRALANKNADSALTAHSQRAQSTKQKYRLGVAIGSFGFAIALMGLFPSGGNGMYWICIGCVVLALISGLQYVAHASQLAAAKESEDEASPANQG